MKELELELEQEIKLFKKINGKEKIVTNNHQNFNGGNSKKTALYNQGIGRAKLRKFIIEKDIDIDFWENLE